MFKRGSRSRHIAIALVIIFGLMVIVTFATATLTNRSTAATDISLVKHPSTVTLIVTGARSDVTYNDGYRAVTTKGPFQITLHLKPGRNYTIGSFNVKPGNSACAINFGSKEVASTKALGEGSTSGCVLAWSKSAQAWTASTW